MEIYTDPKKRFEALFGFMEKRLNGQKSLSIHQHRQAAIKRFAELDFPSLRDEDWKYTSVSRVLQPKYTLHSEISAPASESVLPSLKDSIEIRFSNGHWVKGETPMPAGLHLMSIQEALENERWSALLNKELFAPMQETQDIFSQLNVAFMLEGIFIYVEKGVDIRPILYLNIENQAETEPVLSSMSTFIYLEENASLQLLEHFQPKPEGQSEVLVNMLQKVIQKPNSHLQQYKVQEMQSDSFLIYQSSIQQYRDSVYTHFNADLGGRMVRNNITCIQMDPNVSSNLYGVNLGRGEQHIDTQTTIDHASPHGLSNELYRSLLHDKSRNVFNGKVIVRQDAQKINAFQQNDSLLLSDRSRSDAKPQLEIFADDVRCSHGATIGQLDQEQVFYLMSRGLSRLEAEGVLQWSFLGKVTDHINQSEIKSFIDSRIMEKL
jgi:Fe-S cluster assembly protein SufD